MTKPTLNKAQNKKFDKKFVEVNDKGVKVVWLIGDDEIGELKQHLADELAREFRRGVDFGAMELEGVLAKQKKDLC